ncbi:MAG: capsule biosynthesis protein CapK, partial [Alphaproteobacteria bacterium]|nr:capsule biosynthesis protein CapK [Alphaproteobacteria bacterium]
NDYLPLLRYRTGDFASLDLSGATPALRDLEGRPPVRLEDSRGRPVNTIDVTKALTPLPLAGFHLRQRADRSIELTGWGALSVFADGAVRAALAPIFGDLTISLRLDDHAPPDGKPLPFSSELPPDEIEGW